MDNPPADAELSRLLSLTAHELRNPLSTVMGYIRFVTRDSEVAEKHRKWLETALGSCDKLRDVIEQLSEYSKLESREILFTRKPINLDAVLEAAVESLPPMFDREVVVDLSRQDGSVTIQADEGWVKKALTSVLKALRLEVGVTDRLLVERRERTYHGEPASWILIGDAAQIAPLRGLNEDGLGWFDDKNRGNLGLTLWIAKRVVEGHGGGIWAPASASKGGGGVVALPHS